MENQPTTQERLLQAASAVFAEKGFRDATVADICERADANIAAVNYHFGDKEKLYEEVWRRAFAVTAAAYPIDGGLPEDASVEDLLFSFANAIVHRIFCDAEAGIFAKLLFHELASPTLALDKIADDVLLPQGEHVDGIVKRLLGEDLDEGVLFLCTHCIIGQCAFFNFSRPVRERIIGKKNLSEEELVEIARQIARFSLGGLKAIGERN